MRRLCIVMAVTCVTACAARIRDTGVTPLPDNPAANYPETLADSGIVGEVIAEATVDSAGTVVPGSVVVVKSVHPQLDAEAVRTLAMWRFQPARESGQLVSQRIRVPFRFALRQPTTAECRKNLAAADSSQRARSGRSLANEPQPLRLVAMLAPPRRSTETRTVAEFLVDTTGVVNDQSVRILQSTIPTSDALKDIQRVISHWRFDPAQLRGCRYSALVRHEFVY